MRTKINIIIIQTTTILTVLVCSCTKQKSASCDSLIESMWGNDPNNTEEVYYQSPLDSVNEDFREVSYKNLDGSVTRNISTSTFVDTKFYRLYSPKGNLRLIVAGASEMADVYGYQISYNTKGVVDSISLLKPLCDIVKDGISKLSPSSAHDLFKQWMQSPKSIQHNYVVKRDSSDNVIAIGNVIIRDDYRAKFYIQEWGPFWTSDIRGGTLGIFVLQEYQGDKSGSYVNYLYQDDHLVAELAYWKGTFIKARTYNHYGCMVRQYNDRNIHIEDQAFEDWEEVPKWYVD